MVTALILAIGACLIAGAILQLPPARREQLPRVPQDQIKYVATTGQTGVLNPDEGPRMALIEKDPFDAVQAASEHAYYSLAIEGPVPGQRFFVPVGTRVVVLSTEPHGVTHVRILDGRYARKDGWVKRTWVRP